jgi:hypothetical protein
VGYRIDALFSILDRLHSRLCLGILSLDLKAEAELVRKFSGVMNSGWSVIMINNGSLTRLYFRTDSNAKVILAYIFNTGILVG